MNRYAVVLLVSIVAVTVALIAISSEPVEAQSQTNNNNTPNGKQIKNNPVAPTPDVIEFDGIGQYIAFENKMKQKLGLPLIGKNYESGKDAPSKQLTIDYSEPIFNKQNGNNKIIIFLDNNADLTGQNVIKFDNSTGEWGN